MRQKESGDLYSLKVLKVAGLGLLVCNKAVKWRARGWATTNSAARALLLAITALSSCMRFICAVAACGSREKQSGMVSSVASSAYLREAFFMPYIYGTYITYAIMNICLGLLLFFVPTVSRHLSSMPTCAYANNPSCPFHQWACMVPHLAWPPRNAVHHQSH